MTASIERHKQRMTAVTLYGKDLVRRSGAHCELCDASGTPLEIYEVAPVPKSPTLDHCIFICTHCFEQIIHPEKIDSNHWHCLYTSAWSDVPAIQVVSIMQLQHLQQEEWAAELLSNLYINEDVERWLSSLNH